MLCLKYFLTGIKTTLENDFEKRFGPLSSLWFKLPYVNIRFKTIYNY